MTVDQCRNVATSVLSSFLLPVQPKIKGKKSAFSFKGNPILLKKMIMTPALPVTTVVSRVRMSCNCRVKGQSVWSHDPDCHSPVPRILATQSDYSLADLVLMYTHVIENAMAIDVDSAIIYLP